MVALFCGGELPTNVQIVAADRDGLLMVSGAVYLCVGMVSR